MAISSQASRWILCVGSSLTVAALAPDITNDTKRKSCNYLQLSSSVSIARQPVLTRLLHQWGEQPDPSRPACQGHLGGGGEREHAGARLQMQSCTSGWAERLGKADLCRLEAGAQFPSIYLQPSEAGHYSRPQQEGLIGSSVWLGHAEGLAKQQLHLGQVPIPGPPASLWAHEQGC